MRWSIVPLVEVAKLQIDLSDEAPEEDGEE